MMSLAPDTFRAWDPLPPSGSFHPSPLIASDCPQLAWHRTPGGPAEASRCRASRSGRMPWAAPVGGGRPEALDTSGDRDGDVDWSRRSGGRRPSWARESGWCQCGRRAVWWRLSGGVECWYVLVDGGMGRRTSSRVRLWTSERPWSQRT